MNKKEKVDKLVDRFIKWHRYNVSEREIASVRAMYNDMSNDEIDRQINTDMLDNRV